MRMADLCAELNVEDQFGDSEVWDTLQDLELKGYITLL